MWTHKNSKNIIYIDIEKQLWNKPTIYADCTQTPFKDKTFDAIFFDPPHDVPVHNGKKGTANSRPTKLPIDISSKVYA